MEALELTLPSMLRGPVSDTEEEEFTDLDSGIGWDWDLVSRENWGWACSARGDEGPGVVAGVGCGRGT